jgi:hypothetical protein
MTVIDRYLAAVGENLPRRQRDDILRELADDLHAQADDRADALGRPLTDDEQADLVRAFGEPMAVASRYRPDDRGLAFGRRLIGPELFPSYLRVLGLNLVIALVAGVILGVIGLRDSLLDIGVGIAATFAIQFIIVTTVFILIDRRYVARPGAWDPRSRPGGYPPEAILDDLADTSAVRDGRVSRVASAVSIAWLLIVLGWWLAMPSIVEAATPFEPGPGWSAVFVPGLALFALWLAQPIVNLVRPDLVGFRTLTRILGEAATILLAVVSLEIGDWLVLTDPQAASPELLDLEGLIERIIGISLGALIVVSALSIAGEVRGHLRRQGADRVSGT